MSDRLTVDTITSDQLDALYDERDRLRLELDQAYRRHDSRDAMEFALGPLVDRPFRSHRKPTVRPTNEPGLTAPDGEPICTCAYGEPCPNCRD